MLYQALAELDLKSNLNFCNFNFAFYAGWYKFHASSATYKRGVALANLFQAAANVGGASGG